jgi:pimeloyl-ACP methyl ester carboxylesterase
MPTPSQEAIQASHANLQSGMPLTRDDFFNIIWAFVHHPDQDRYILETNGFNEKLAETFIIFRKPLVEADDIKPVIDRAFLHYIVNTPGQIPELEGEDPFNVFEAATQYAHFLSVGVSKADDGTSLLEVDGKKIPCPEWNALPGWSAAWSLRKVGPVINRVRYGRDDIIPSIAFGFNAASQEHQLENAMTMADFSHLAYFGPAYIERQLTDWGYTDFHWIEDKKTDTQAFACKKDEHIVLCFRGTSSATDALVDAKFLKTDSFDGSGRVHRGFKGAVDSVWADVQQAVRAIGTDLPIYVAGHSLGAALAQLAAYRLAKGGSTIAAVYVYGSPRVGNKAYADAYNALLESKTFLHINNKDIVARIPPPFLGYRHLGGGPRQFDEGHNLTLMPKSKGMEDEEVDMDFEELDEEMQERIMAQMREAQLSMEASTAFLNTPPELLEAGNYKGVFDVGPVDDHSMDEYLFKFGCAIVDGEWKRIGRTDEPA